MKMCLLLTCVGVVGGAYACRTVGSLEGAGIETVREAIPG